MEEDIKYSEGTILEIGKWQGVIENAGEGVYDRCRMYSVIEIQDNEANYNRQILNLSEDAIDSMIELGVAKTLKKKFVFPKE